MTARPPRIGSLCTGYGGLDMAVEAVFGARTVWHAQYDPADKHQHAAKILTHHWPDVPNHGDITAIDWDQVEPVDILTAGFPCQDVSLAGKRAGMREGTRSGLWSHVARAIQELQPRMVVIENVPGLLSSRADSDVEPCPWCLGDTDSEPPLRALGAVLADLAELGFDAQWQSLRAADVGACHQRNRIFIVAWPADPAGAGLEDAREGRPARGRTEPVPHPASDGRGEGRPESAGQQGRSDASVGGGRPAAHTADLGFQRGGQHGDGGPDLRTAIGTVVAADSDSEPRDQRRNAAPEQAPSRGASAVDCGCDRAPWGRYAAAVHQWEQVIGRPVPSPVDVRGRLSPLFVEHLMGLPEGHVTGVPDLPRNAQLKALGNGVVPQQAEAALRVLLDRAARVAA